MVRVGVMASGNGSNFENLVRASRDGRAKAYEITVLVVDKADAFALQRAENLKIPAFFVNPRDFADKQAYEREVIRILEAHQVEVVALAGYMRILSPVLLNRYQWNLLNIHPAYLPEFRGKDGIGDAFRAGVSQTGVSIHHVDEGIDTGEIVYQERLEIDAQWSLEELQSAIHALEHALYPRVLNDFCQKKEQA